MCQRPVLGPTATPSMSASPNGAGSLGLTSHVAQGETTVGLIMYLSPASNVEARSPVTQNGTGFGDDVSKQVIQFKQVIQVMTVGPNPLRLVSL